MDAQPEVVFVTQAELARHFGVSRAAVSQWKANDILREDAFEKPGKTGKLILHIAEEHVRKNRDIGQSLGNGLTTKTSAAKQPAVTPTPAPVAETVRAEPAPAGNDEPAARQADPDAPPSIEDQLKSAKLEQQLRTNRMQAAEEATLQGKLMLAADAREQMARIAVVMLQIFEGAMPDIATAMAAQFGVPERDVLHLLRAEFRKVRKTAAAKQRAAAEERDQAAQADI